ncbi:MAG TPA: hypothetical protein VOA80_24290 [Thermoanaerobaculia bacterium]|nr:hypothetical protein [Thermoanaerobaculia bacterium]
MKKREARLSLSKETIRHLMVPVSGLDLIAAAGGSCTKPSDSTAGGSAKVCCDPY